jgi:hypothetical protein
MSDWMRAEFLVNTLMFAFAEEMQIDVSESGCEIHCGTLRLSAFT